DNRLVLTVCRDQPGVYAVKSEAVLWDAGTGQRARVLKSGEVGNLTVHHAVFSPDGRSVVAGGNLQGATGGKVQVWEVGTGVPTTSWMERISVNRVALSPDGRRVATSDVGSLARTRDAVTGLPVASFPSHRGGIRSVAFSP